MISNISANQGLRKVENGKLVGFFFGFFLLLPAISIILACNKLVQVPNPINTVTSNQVFNDESDATSALLGIYSYMNKNNSFSTFETTNYLGQSADELTNETPGNETGNFFLCNKLNALQVGSIVNLNFWQPAYFDIYSSNAVIAGVQASTGLTATEKKQLIGDAEFIRAFCYFYLTNLFGDIPLVLTTDFNQTVLLAKVPQAKIYQQIIDDLNDAESVLSSDFSLSGGLPIRANKWSATALLARVYLYTNNWQGADSASSAVIGSGAFKLISDLNSVFLANSGEAIFQLQTLNTNPFATLEGNFFIPYDSTRSPNCWLSTQLLNAFEPNDMRRINWVDSSDYNGVYYYYPYKYKSRVGSPGNITENYTVLRFSEQYLIRAEAEAELGGQQNLGQAIADINTIRTRAGLPSLTSNLSQTQLLLAVQQENRIEFFAEWGHRWLDIRRWGIAIETLDTIAYKKATIDSTQLLYPIPPSELQDDPNLVQNKGYY